ncbi:MAG: hypothetical protein FJ146_19725 [Deltaproteobacteria bacterium]|nr:hypothetical protein [Deltaproteobacteria bacterium]
MTQPSHKSSHQAKQEQPFSKVPVATGSTLTKIGGELSRRTRWNYFFLTSAILAAAISVAYFYAPAIIRNKLVVTLLLMGITPLRGVFPRANQSTLEMRAFWFWFYEVAIVGLGLCFRSVAETSELTPILILGAALYPTIIVTILAFSYVGRVVNALFVGQFVILSTWAIMGNPAMHPWIVPWITIMLGTSLYAVLTNDSIAKNLDRIWDTEKKTHELSVQNERLRVAAIEKDLELASQVQESLVTQFDPFDWHGYRVEYYQKKFDKLGGDWFGARILSSGDLVLAVTDVSGKGVAAAMVAQAIHTLWVGTLFEEEFSPEAFLHSANKTLLMMGAKVPHTATMGIAVVSKQDVKYYSAGHVPLVIDYGVQEAKRFVPVIATGGILGMSPVLALSMKQIAINQAHVKGILIGTDGIFHGGTSLRQKGLGVLLDKLDTQGVEALESYGAADDKLLIWAKRNASG